jgi:hypothetical protein
LDQADANGKAALDETLDPAIAARHVSGAVLRRVRRSLSGGVWDR